MKSSYWMGPRPLLATDSYTDLIAVSNRQIIESEEPLIIWRNREYYLVNGFVPQSINV